MKLFSKEESVAVESLDKVVESKELEITSLDSELERLERTVDGYVSVGVVYESISENSLGFVDKKNYVLFNEYIKTVTKNLGLDSVPVISTESIETSSTLMINSQLALEGFIGDMWKKVQGLFKKIYEGIKAFFVKHFTRVGRVKKKLTNLKEVLSETDKDIKQLNLDKVPSGIAKAFPINGDVSFSEVSKGLELVELVIKVLEVTNRDAIKLANKEILDRDFVSTVKGLKDQIKANSDKIDENNSNKVGGLKGLVGSGRATNKELNADNKSLSELNKENQKSVDGKEAKLDLIVSDKENSNLDDKAFEAIKRELAQYYTDVAKVFKPLEGKPLPNGKTLKEATVNEDGISLEFDENKDEPSSVTLGSKSDLIGLVDTMLSLIDKLEKTTDNFTKVNDVIMKNIDTVDMLVKELDKVTDNENYKKYKAVLEKKVRERLKVIQKFFSEYNKISKNMVDVVMEIGDGVVVYTVTSLKHFG